MVWLGTGAVWLGAGAVWLGAGAAWLGAGAVWLGPEGAVATFVALGRRTTWYAHLLQLPLPHPQQ